MKHSMDLREKNIQAKNGKRQHSGDALAYLAKWKEPIEFECSFLFVVGGAAAAAVVVVLIRSPSCEWLICVLFESSIELLP